MSPLRGRLEKASPSNPIECQWVVSILHDSSIFLHAIFAVEQELSRNSSLVSLRGFLTTTQNIPF